MRLASFKMYVTPPPLAEATAELWGYLQARLRQAGIADAPETLDDSVAYDDAWLRPELLLAQTCGYPYASRLRQHAKLVATPIYGHPGCDGPSMRSFIIARKDFPAATLEEFRGARAAINSPDSNSGMNLFRAAIAPLARDGRFFSEVIETGSHTASIAAIAEGRADAAAIDCITYASIERFDPAKLATIRILAETPGGPGLPVITSIDTPERELAQLRAALQESINEPALAKARDVLGLKGFAVVSDAEYDVLLDYERQAISLGYPVPA